MEDKELVEAATKYSILPPGCYDGPIPMEPPIFSDEAYEAFLAGARWQRDRKPTIGEDHED